VGAIYAGTIFALAAIGSAFFQEDGFVSLYIFLGSIFIYTLYYFAYAKARQQISPEEKEIFLSQIVKCKYTRLMHALLYFSLFVCSRMNKAFEA
jgi:hypothetical protein